MKNFIIILSFLFLFHNVGKAQDYRVIVPAQKQFFKIVSGNLWSSFNMYTNSQYKVAYFDSSSSAGLSTSHYTFNTWRDTSSWWQSLPCTVEDGPSWFGSHVVELNGTYYLFNAKGDTIHIKNNAIIS